jgi:hypothetical protein
MFEIIKMETTFSTQLCKGHIKQVSNFDLEIQGRIIEPVKNNEVFYVAAAPADYRASYTGSGLPFANQIQAFEGSPNIGSLRLDGNNAFSIKIMIPNSYLVGLGSVTVPPTLYIEYINMHDQSRTISIKLSNGIPYRTLTYPMYPRPRKDASFYDSQFYLKVRSQEQILVEAGYPKVNYVPDNHWGTKPPL